MKRTALTRRLAARIPEAPRDRIVHWFTGDSVESWRLNADGTTEDLQLPPDEYARVLAECQAAMGTPPC